MLAIAVIVIALIVAAPLQGQDAEEAGSRAAIAAATTETRFLSPWVDYVPDHPTVPSPTEHLGHIVGAPGELTRSAAIYAYYRALAAASDRVQVEVIGESEEGREILLVIIGDAESLGQLERFRDDMARLADPRLTDEAAMEAIVESTKPFYMLHAGLHSTETGSPEMVMELAYRLAVSEVPFIKAIRDRLIILINPVAEPDGRDRAVDWFYRHLKGKTDFEQLPRISPPYWGKYVFHDNNRDAIQRKLALTRATQDAFLKWHPIVLHDLHESLPLLSTWTGTGPYNLNVDPIALTEWHAIAFHEVTTLTSFGMPGVWTWGFGEGWAHVYADSVAVNHNAIGKGYETFGNGTAETVERRLDPKRARYTDRAITDRDWYRPLPPPKEFRWSMRNNTNYMQTGVLSALQYTTLHRDDMMRNFWRRGRNAVHKGRTEAPYAFVIREEQKDLLRLARLVNLLRAHDIEVSRSPQGFTVGGAEYPGGTYIVQLDQPYRGYAIDLLQAQKFPADTARYKSYDDVGWALPFSLGVEVEQIDELSILSVDVEAVTEDVGYSGTFDGRGRYFLLRDQGQEALLAARFRLRDFEVGVAEGPFVADGTDYSAGAWVIAAQEGVESVLEQTSAELALDFVAAHEAPSVAVHAADLPRLAVLQTWADTESAGWVRMILDEERIPYALIMDEEVRSGGLGSRFDVILFPNTYASLKGIVGGIDPKHSPLPYTQTPEFPSHGTPTSSRDITGGLTWNGVQHLENFVRQGGVLVTLGGASRLPLDGGIARDVSRASMTGVYTPGSELRARFRRPDHPIAYGYPETLSAFRENLPLYSVPHAHRNRIVMQWGTELADADEEEEEGSGSDASSDSLVVSGGIKGAKKVAGKPAILDIPTGDGRVVAFDFDPLHRYQTMSDFRLLWNVILNWNDLPQPSPG
jgi:hypothetical protein